MKKSKMYILVGVMVACAGVFAVFGVLLWNTNRAYAQGDDLYANLREQVKFETTGNSSQEGTHQPPPQDKDTIYTLVHQVDVPEIGVDFEALKQVNEDTIAWLHCPGTVIDYPVMRGSDYEHYLNYLPDGKKNANGSLFTDYNLLSDFSGQHNIIYGHAMKSGKMFGTLNKWKQQAYFDDYPYLYLYTPEGNYRIDIAYGFVISAEEWRLNGFIYEVTLPELLRHAGKNSMIQSPVQVGEEDKILAMSTCSREFNDARFVVIGVMNPEYDWVPVDEVEATDGIS